MRIITYSVVIVFIVASLVFVYNGNEQAGINLMLLSGIMLNHEDITRLRKNK